MGLNRRASPRQLHTASHLHVEERQQQLRESSTEITECLAAEPAVRPQFKLAEGPPDSLASSATRSEHVEEGTEFRRADGASAADVGDVKQHCHVARRAEHISQNVPLAAAGGAPHAATNALLHNSALFMDPRRIVTMMKSSHIRSPS